MKVISNFIRRLPGTYRKLRLREKILVSYTVLLIVLVASLGSAALWQMSKLVNDRFLSSVSGSLLQLATHISYRMRIVGNSTEMLLWDNDLNRLLTYGVGSDSLATQIDDIRVARNIILPIKLNEDVSGVRLYLRDHGLLSRERDTFYPLQDVEDETWANSVRQSGGRAVWTVPHDVSRFAPRVTTLSRCIQDRTGSGDCLAILVVDIDPHAMKKVLTQSGLLREARTLLLFDSVAGHVISVVGSPPPSSEDNTHIVLEQRLPFPDWTLHAYINRATIQRERNHLVVSFVAILLAVSFGAMLLTFSISRHIASRVTRLARIVADPDSAPQEEPYEDELTELQRFLVRLVQGNRELLQQVFADKVAEKEAKLRELQSQINPHFLYNTLDTINWMALKKKDHEISTVVGQLAQYYRLSIGTKTDVVALRDEIAHVKAFLGIYEARFEGLIRAEYELDERVLDFNVIRLILQPLAENAVLHGISKTESQSGVVSIRAGMVDGAIEIRVSDDGVGLSKEDLRRIMEDDSQGFALKNINERIRLFCGPEYGLAFDFSVERGTCAFVRLSVPG